MPARIKPEVRLQIVELLEQRLQAVEVRRRLKTKGVAVSLGTITREAYRLGIELKGGSRKGVPGIGRPPGPGKKYSRHRAKVLELRAQGMSLRAIGAEIGLTRQGVAQLLNTAPVDNAGDAGGDHAQPQ